MPLHVQAGKRFGVLPTVALASVSRAGAAWMFLILCSSLLIAAANQNGPDIREQPGNKILMNDDFEYELADYGVGSVQLRKNEEDTLSPPLFRVLIRVTNKSNHLLATPQYLGFSTSLTVKDNWGNSYTAWHADSVLQQVDWFGSALPIPPAVSARFKPGESSLELRAIALSEFVKDIHELRVRLSYSEPYRFFALHDPMSRRRDLLRERSEPSVTGLQITTGVETQPRPTVPKRHRSPTPRR